MKRRLETTSAQLPFGELNDLLQHRARLGAAVLLARHEQLSFSRLKALLDETDGNLGAQMRKLEDAGYVKIEKTWSGALTRDFIWSGSTLFVLTDDNVNIYDVTDPLAPKLLSQVQPAPAS